jgi:hypothetical protein
VLIDQEPLDELAKWYLKTQNMVHTNKKFFETFTTWLHRNNKTIVILCTYFALVYGVRERERERSRNQRNKPDKRRIELLIQFITKNQLQSELEQHEESAQSLQSLTLTREIYIRALLMKLGYLSDASYINQIQQSLNDMKLLDKFKRILRTRDLSKIRHKWSDVELQKAADRLSTEKSVVLLLSVLATLKNSNGTIAETPFIRVYINRLFYGVKKKIEVVRMGIEHLNEEPPNIQLGHYNF